jgi:hypothetical protein
MYAVDLWADLPVQDVEKDMNRGVTNYHKFPLAMYEQEVRKLVESYGNQCTILKMDTVAAAAYVPNKSLDFVFIDACHESDAVRADIKAWTPKLRASGMLMGHDANWPSVRRVIDVMCPRWTSGSDNVWYLRKEFVRL